MKQKSVTMETKLSKNGVMDQIKDNDTFIDKYKRKIPNADSTIGDSVKVKWSEFTSILILSLTKFYKTGNVQNQKPVSKDILEIVNIGWKILAAV